MKLFVFVLLATYPLLATSQQAPMKFGDVPREALDMKIYSPDSSAAAVYLVDYGVSTIEYNSSEGFVLFFEHTKRIKVLTEEGKKWADFEIYLYKEPGEHEDLVFVKGVT